MWFVLVLLAAQLKPPEFRPGQKLPESPNDVAYAAAKFLQSAVDAERKAGNTTSYLHASNLRFLSLYNLPANGTRRKLGTKGNEVEAYSPLDDMVRVLIFTVNQLNRTNPVVTLIKVKPDLFALHIDSPGWSRTAWEGLASKDVYFRQEWIEDPTWLYLTGFTYSQHPIMMASQFVATATVAPDYYELLSLPKTVAEFYKQLGIDEKLLTDTYRIKGSVKTDGLTVTFNNRILERRQGAFDVWSSNDVINSRAKKNALTQLDVIGGDIHRLDIDGQEHIFELGWGGFGGFLNNAKGERVDEVPITIASDDEFRDRRVIAGRSCITCHDQAIRPFQSDQAKLLQNQVVQLRTIRPEDAIALAGRYDEKTVQRFIRFDQEAYRSAEEELTGTTPEKMALMFANTWRDYAEKRVSLHQAALDTGLSDDGFVAVLIPSVNPNLLKYMEDPANTLSRDVWEDVVDDVLLLKGKPAPTNRPALPVIDEKMAAPKVVDKDDEPLIEGSIVLTAAKVVGEVQEAKVTIKTKKPISIKGYTKTESVWMAASTDVGTSHVLSFKFTAQADGFPTKASVELSTGKYLDIPVTTKAAQ